MNKAILLSALLSLLPLSAQADLEFNPFPFITTGSEVNPVLEQDSIASVITPLVSPTIQSESPVVNIIGIDALQAAKFRDALLKAGAGSGGG